MKDNNKPIAYAIQEKDRIVLFTAEDERIDKKGSVPLYFPELLKFLKMSNVTWYFDALGELNTRMFTILPCNAKTEVELLYDRLYGSIYGDVDYQKCAEVEDSYSRQEKTEKCYTKEASLDEAEARTGDYKVSDNGKYMLVITQDRIFMVLRNGRNTNKYGVQFCIDDRTKEEWSGDCRLNNIFWKRGIIKKENPSLYCYWKEKLKEAHIDNNIGEM